MNLPSARSRQEDSRSTGSIGSSLLSLKERIGRRGFQAFETRFGRVVASKERDDQVVRLLPGRAGRADGCSGRGSGLHDLYVSLAQDKRTYGSSEKINVLLKVHERNADGPSRFSSDSHLTSA